jgi:hypothetical protein
MNIEIKINCNDMTQYFEIVEIIRKFAYKCGLYETDYSENNPHSTYLDFENAKSKQFTDIKRRLRNSKRLKDIKYTITANDVS